MAEPEPSPVESLPALRAAGSRGPAPKTSYIVAIAALVAAAVVVLLVLRPWASDRDVGPPKPTPAEIAQVRFDAERNPSKIIAAMGIGPGSRVADIGANTGLFTVHLARAVAPDGKVVATEIDTDVLPQLHERVGAAGLAAVVETRVVPADSPGLEAGAYDAILISHADHLFEDPVAWLVAAKAALRPSGRITITNVLHHRRQGMAAAEKAGLILVTESAPTPEHYLAVFTAN